MGEHVNYAEERLIAQMQSGSEAALAAVIRQYTAYVGAVVNSVSGGRLSRQDEEELLADVFFALWNNADKLRPGKLKSYLGTIARNKTKSALRRKGCEMSMEEDFFLISSADPERELTKAEEAAIVQKAVDALPEPDRTILIRRYFLCQKAAQIAEVLHMNANTVQTKINRGRERLRLALQEGGYFVE